MLHRKWILPAIGVAAVAMVAAGCGGGTSSSSGNKTLTVWLMAGSAPDATVAAIDKDFEAANPGVNVKYEVQQWNGIGQKLTTALTGTNGPDVLELGNTQVSQYSSQGTLTDITSSENDLNGSQWLPALKESGAYDGKQYGVPFYAANRVVIYRTDLFQQAGISAPPTSNDEWLADLTKLKALPGIDPLYLPGQEWYTLASFIWDQGGELASGSGANWKSAINTPQAKAGFAFYKQLVDTSGTSAPKDTDEATPQQSDVVAKGDTASFIGFGYELAAIEKANPALKGKFAAFPIPSRTAGQTAPVFLGGSDLAIPANSQNVDLAKAWLKIETSAKYQSQLAAGGSVPGTSTDTSALNSTETGKAMAEGAKNGKVTPITPKWAAVEANNPLKAALTAYLTGQKSLDQAVADADAAITKTLTSSS